MKTWELFADDRLLYSPTADDQHKVFSPKLELDVDKAAKLTFTIFPNNTYYQHIYKMATTIVLTCDGEIKFRGRVLNDTLGWKNEKTVVCEGELAFLNDSVQRPFSFPMDEEHTGPADYFTFLIGRHNQQVEADRQFVVGNITVTDPNNYIARSDTEYSSTWTLIKEGLLDTLGGYIWFRHENGITYIDYLEDFSVLANQSVEFGVNMLSLKTERKGQDIASAILPLGKKPEEGGDRVTIAPLEDTETSDICKTGDYVWSKEAVETYGFIIKTVVWDDVTVPANLLTKAAAELARRKMIASTVTLTAADLSAAGYDVNTFSIGTYVRVIDDKHEAHDLLAMYLIKKLTINWLSPEQNTLTVGATTYSMTEKTHQQTADAMKTVESNVTERMTYALSDLELRYESAIQQSSDTILLTVSENYYTKDETDNLVETVSTEIEQTAAGIEIRFNSLSQDIDDVQAGADAKFASLQSYIQMAGGSITLGQTGNDITLKIENDQIGIYSSGVLITYWTVQDFVAPKTLRIPVGGRLILGDYAFIPRSNGSLDFTWVGV